MHNEIEQKNLLNQFNEQ